MRQKHNHSGLSVSEDYDYLSNSASASDCTGLIPSQPLSKAERASYEEMYHYLPKAGPASQSQTPRAPGS